MMAPLTCRQLACACNQWRRVAVWHLSVALKRINPLRHERQTDSRRPNPIEPIQLKEALEERYLAYALSTIMHRALPDVRDGLKPVHRRILYAMQLLRLDPNGNFLKCAKIVGDTMGDFHPHGNQAIYDALGASRTGFRGALSAGRWAGQLRQYRRR